MLCNASIGRVAWVAPIGSAVFAIALPLLSPLVPADPERLGRYYECGIPMIVVVWPMLLKSLPLMTVVGYVAARRSLHLDWSASLRISGTANAIFVFLGTPATWLLVFSVQLASWFIKPNGLFPDGSRTTAARKVVGTIASSPWLVAKPGEYSWALPAAGLILCLPLCVASTAFGYLIARGFVAKEMWPAARRWSMLSNAISFGLIVAYLIARLLVRP